MMMVFCNHFLEEELVALLYHTMCSIMIRLTNVLLKICDWISEKVVHTSDSMNLEDLRPVHTTKVMQIKYALIRIDCIHTECALR